MKVRTGFVSNSSSSSFIIKTEDLTMEQLEKLSHDYRLLVRNGCVQSCQEFESLVETRQYLEELGIDAKLIHWTCVDFEMLLGR